MEQQVNTTTMDVFLRHLGAVKTGQIEAIMADYSPDAILLTQERTFHGAEGVRAFFEGALASFPAAMLDAMTPVRYETHDEIAFVVWKAEPYVKMGTDTLVIRDGKILVQTFVMV